MERPQIIKQTAEQRLHTAAFAPRKLVLIHSGAALGFSLILTILNFAAAQGMADTGGLSGIGMRSILETVQTVLQYASMILLPFWQIGFLAAALAMAREQTFDLRTLFRGFHRFPSVLGLMISQTAVMLLGAFACVYISSAIFVATPYAEPFMAVIQPALEEATLLSGSQIYLDEATMMAAIETMKPMLLLTLVIYLIVMIPVFYRFRMAQFLIVDQAPISGARALITSMKLMRRNRFRLFQLDLQFWWYYLLQALALVVGYGDTILPLLGIELPINANVAFFAFYLLCLAGQLGLHILAKAKIQTAYALVYDQLRESLAQPEQPKPAPSNLPWDYEQ